MFAKLLIVSLLIAEAASLMCYRCQDTSAEPGKNSCQRWVRTMNKYRQRHEETGRIDLPYVKDCTAFQNLSEPNVYCAIMKVELSGAVRTYIRGCSDGKDFFSADYNSEVSKYIRSDNQTYCIYTGQGYVACATICDTDFCNGYNSDAIHVTASFWLLWISILVGMFLSNGKSRS